jgi:deoxyadenosine/deoxycytidine kinase
MSKPIILTIEGNIGAGKSTILQKLKDKIAEEEHKHIMFLKEPVDEWDKIRDKENTPFLTKFYENTEKYSFAFQIMACTTRIGVIKRAIDENPECKVFICERSIEADSQIFAKMLHNDGLIGELEYQVYELFYNEHKELYKTSGCVYLDTFAEKCHERVKKRSRDGESGISLEYLEKCQKYHNDWLKNDENKLDMPLLVLDTNDDVTFDLKDETDKGQHWVKEIFDFMDVLTTKNE